jgi:hypothetical protein
MRVLLLQMSTGHTPAQGASARPNRLRPHLLPHKNHMMLMIVLNMLTG